MATGSQVELGHFVRTTGRDGTSRGFQLHLYFGWWLEKGSKPARRLTTGFRREDVLDTAAYSQRPVYLQNSAGKCHRQGRYGRAGDAGQTTTPSGTGTTRSLRGGRWSDFAGGDGVTGTSAPARADSRPATRRARATIMPLPTVPTGEFATERRTPLEDQLRDGECTNLWTTRRLPAGDAASRELRRQLLQ